MIHMLIIYERLAKCLSVHGRWQRQRLFPSYPTRSVGEGRRNMIVTTCIATQR